MKKTILIYDYMKNGEALYEYIKKNDTNKILDNHNIVFIPFRINKSIKDKIKRILEIGILNIIKGLIFKDIIVVSSGPSRFQSLISKNIICMNHGWATKKTPGNNELKDPLRIKEYAAFKKSCKYIICLSDFDSTYYLKGGQLDNIDSPQFIPIGIPRNDYLIENKDNEKIILSLGLKFKLKKSDKKVFFYAPTHRDDKLKDEIMLEKILNEFEQLDEKLEQIDSVLIFRPHYFTIGLKSRIDRFKNIHYAGYDEYPDTRDLMIFSDILITDYSSIFIDYLLIDKPIIFYPFDINEYIKNRGLVIEYDNNIHTPGPKIKKISEIVDIDYSNLSEYNLFESKKFFHANYNKKCCEKFYYFLLNQIEM